MRPLERYWPANEGGCHGDVAQGTNNKGERIIGERQKF
jgi:hypothetical protein